MRTSLSTLLVFLVLAGGGSADAYGQAAGAASAKRYPWDMRQPKCFLPDAIPSAQCKANDWPDYGESKRHVDRLLVENHQLRNQCLSSMPCPSGSRISALAYSPSRTLGPHVIATPFVFR